MIEADIELPVLLRHIVEEACSLVEARYGALGCAQRSRTGLEQFLTVGLSDEDEEGHRCPAHRARCTGVADHRAHSAPARRPGGPPRELRVPGRHPPMKSFLGVPIRVRADDEVYGNLYLTDKIGGRRFQ